MARFSTPPQGLVTSPGGILVAPQYAMPVPAATREGGAGYEYNEPQSALFLAAVSGLLKDQFYESGDDRVLRLVDLVPKCDPDWLRGFVRWLRTDANLRSAPLVIAAEYVRAKFPNGRTVVSSVLQRADEPGEILAYWRGRYGRQLPMALKRGVADAVDRLYTERATTRYDGQSKGWRFGDVLETVHPKPTTPGQSALFKFLLDRRRHSPEAPGTMLAEDAAALALPEAARTLALAPTWWSWERLAGWLPGGMTAAAWSHVIPSMGYMALIRNLRNFDDAGVADYVKEHIAVRLANPAEVAQSRQLPFRFLNAYLNVASDRWNWPLTQALELSVGNLPHVAGRTLLMVDCSGSMKDPLDRGRYVRPGATRGVSATRSQVAALYAWSIAKRCDQAVIACYDNEVMGAFVEAHKCDSVLRASAAPEFTPRGGTETWKCTAHVHKEIGPFDRIVILTDEQAHDYDGGIKCPVITWNLAGYDVAHAAHGQHNRYAVGGYSDTVLSCLPAVLGLGDGHWPWELRPAPGDEPAMGTGDAGERASGDKATPS